jgi:hypothetical protein
MPQATNEHTPIAPYEEWPLGALDVANHDLATALNILGHLIDVHADVRQDTWQSVEDDLNDAAGVIKQLWRQAWDRQLVERREHEAELEADRAERAAPGSPGRTSSRLRPCGSCSALPWGWLPGSAPIEASHSPVSAGKRRN